MLQTSIVSQIRTNARLFPEAPALSVVGGESLTYAQVWRRTRALADLLADVPVTHGFRPVALLLPNGIDASLSYLACQLAGCVAVPVNTRLAASEMDFILQDSGATTILAAAPFLERARDLAQPRGARVVDCDKVQTPDDVRLEPVEIDGDAPAVVGYTSGTTGMPKGGVYSNDTLYLQYMLWSRQYRIDETSTVLTLGPMFHLSYAGLTTATLVMGGQVRIVTEFDPAVAVEELAERATFAFLVPTMAGAIIEQARAEGRTSLDSIRFVLSSGAPISAELLAEEIEFFPHATIAEAYGWSEGGWVTFETKTPETLLARCVGRPSVGVELEVLREDRTPCDVGEPGEIAVRNSLPFAGYLNNEAKTQESTWNGFVLSGDIGEWTADGRVLVVDRLKDMIVTGGENVYSAEVERVVLQHPDVVEVGVIGRPDDKWGEVITAIVVTRDPGLDPDALKTFCREHLAGYKVPKIVEFRDELPRNAMGKLQKFLLRESSSADTVTEPVPAS